MYAVHLHVHLRDYQMEYLNFKCQIIYFTSLRRKPETYKSSCTLSQIKQVKIISGTNGLSQMLFQPGSFSLDPTFDPSHLLG